MCVCVCVHPHRHSLSHACNDIQNFLHACVHFCMCVLLFLMLLLLLLYVYVCTPAECSARPSVAKTTLFYFLQRRRDNGRKGMTTATAHDRKRTERTCERVSNHCERDRVPREDVPRERLFSTFSLLLSLSRSLVC